MKTGKLSIPALARLKHISLFQCSASKIKLQAHTNSMIFLEGSILALDIDFRKAQDISITTGRRGLG